ncbi:hypothetical protein [uncultured Draconibacterium sp.]|uniref:hypothetical protein n=1 Tax=uncultured Draconibacterium sp. TaxID=1573823 RepID=UPI0025F94D9A|nr:hypothetical protein [uncultured Draconibacterium sp.]
MNQVKRKIHCNECEKFLFETEKSDGAAGAQAQRLGFVFKMPFLFTGKYSALFFCDSACSKEFYRKNIPKNAEASKKLAEFKENIPAYAKECARGVSQLSRALKQTRK